MLLDIDLRLSESALKTMEVSEIARLMEDS
jgi:hypothetical protein